jgi:hypothetical protein
MKNLVSKILYITLAITLCALLLPPAASAEDDTAPLDLISRSIVDGSVDIPVDTLITLEFNKNISSLSVIENNTACFKLTDTDGNEIDISVEFGLEDEQLASTVVIRPFILKENTAYTLTISGALESKSGRTLDREITTSFTTMKMPAVFPEYVEPGPDYTPETTPPADGETVETVSKAVDFESNAWVLPVILIALLGLGIVVAVYILRRKRD